MDNRDLARDHAALFAALAARRGDCVELERLIDEDLQGLPDSRRQQIESHLELCPLCSRIARPGDPLEVDDLQWRRIERRLDGRQRPWLEEIPASAGGSGWRWPRPLMAVAAFLLLSLAAVAIWLQNRPPGPHDDGDSASATAQVRGSTIQILEPIGRVTSVDRLAWQMALPLELEYRVEIREGDRLVAELAAGRPTLELGAEVQRLLTPGRSYRWRVVGVAAGEVLAESGWVELELAP